MIMISFLLHLKKITPKNVGKIQVRVFRSNPLQTSSVWCQTRMNGKYFKINQHFLINKWICPRLSFLSIHQRTIYHCPKIMWSPASCNPSAFVDATDMASDDNTVSLCKSTTFSKNVPMWTMESCQLVQKGQKQTKKHIQPPHNRRQQSWNLIISRDKGTLKL